MKECAADLAKHNVLGVDLEFCGDRRSRIAALLQISTLETDYVIDVLILRERVGPILTPVFADEKIVKVFHGSDIDILLLLTDLEVEVINIFDTARAFGEMTKCGDKSEHRFVSFDYLVTALLGIKVNKFFQVAEWKLRPLPKVMMNYSRADSHYLLYIYAILIDLISGYENEVQLLNSTYTENSSWLDIRNSKSHQWSKVLDDFTLGMNKFLLQRIEKSGTRTFKVIVHGRE